MRDLLFRTVYRCAYRVMRVYWWMAHPHTHGALVALWHEGRILLVKNCYLPYHSLPGGYVRRRETGREAARRELFEETGIPADVSELRCVLDEHHLWEGKKEHIQIFEMEATELPQVEIDHREVEWAGFVDPKVGLALPLFPPLRRVLAGRLEGESTPRSGGPSRCSPGNPASGP